MKTRYSILIICLLALIATGCKKENNGRIRIFAENMRNGSKILINPDDPSDAYWVTGETIAINGTSYEIKEDDDGYYLEGVNTLATAIYPGSGDEYNDIEVNGNEVVLKRLTVNFLDEGYGNINVVFPMAAVPNDDDQLFFSHLTGGLKITLEAPDHAIEVASVKIVAQGTSQPTNLSVNGVTATARWAVQGPTLPHGEVGDMEDDYNAAYACEMNIDFVTTGMRWNEYDELVPYVSPGITLYGDTYGNHDSRTFYVPITINSIQYLTVTGYSNTGEQLFHVTKDLGEGNHNIVPNTMYTVPPIQIN